MGDSFSWVVFFASASALAASVTRGCELIRDDELFPRGAEGAREPKQSKKHAQEEEGGMRRGRGARNLYSLRAGFL